MFVALSLSDQDTHDLTIKNRSGNQHKQLEQLIRGADKRHGQVWGMASADHFCPLNKEHSQEHSTNFIISIPKPNWHYDTIHNR